MRGKRALICLFSILICCCLFVGACSNDNVSDKDKQKEVITEARNEAEAGTNDELEEVDATSTEEKASTDNSPSDIQGILKKSAEVMEKTTGMTITGKTDSMTNMMGMEDDETSELTGTITYEPFAQHMEMQLVSEMDGPTDMEMYMTEDVMYMHESEMGWLSMPMDQAGGIGDLTSMMTQGQFDYFAEHADLFELVEDDSNYIIRYSGSGDEMKNIIYGAMKDIAGEEIFTIITEDVTEISGTYEFFVAKVSYYIVGVKTDLDMTLDMGVREVQTSEQSNYKYSDFDDVEAVTVPDEVTENAQSMEDLMEGVGVEQ